MKREINDPMERMIADALEARGWPFEHDATGLDFYLPTLGVHVEVKRFHSERIASQMARAENVIVAQGKEAVELLAEMIAG